MLTIRRLLLISAYLILAVAAIFVFFHPQQLREFFVTYIWAAPLVLFKSGLKKLLLLNFLGIIKLLSVLGYHLFKLGALKFIKTVGFRYATYFSQRRWLAVDRAFMRGGQWVDAQREKLQALIDSLSRWQMAVVVTAYFPVVVTLFLCGVSFRLTRETMVKRGGEIGVVQAAKRSSGLVALIHRWDAQVLKKIQTVTAGPKKAPAAN